MEARLGRFEQWLNDFRWAMNVKRARAYRRTLMFSQRHTFDDELRPKLSGAVIAYPDALYHVEIDDLLRATMAAGQRRGI